MSVGRSYKQHKLDDNWDAIVIGSGVGGLTTASLLSRMANKRVLVLEKHYTAGGFSHTFSRPGYEWDVGVHYIGEVHRPHSLLRRVFDYVSDNELQWADMGEIYDTIVIGDERYEFPRGRDAFTARMKEYFPEHKTAIDTYVQRIYSAAKNSGMFFMEKALPVAIAKIIGPLLRYRAMRDAKKTVDQVLIECGIKPGSKLAGVLCGQYGDYGLPPGQASFLMHAVLVKHYMAGAAYPVGGSAEIARSLIKPIEKNGGAVVTRAPVSQIIFDGKTARGVRLADGRELFAPLVISNAGWAVTWGSLVPQELSTTKDREPLHKISASAGHAALYVGLNKDTSELGLKTSNIWVYPHEDHDHNVDNYLADQNAPLPLAYLSFPSAKDPTFKERFPDRASIEVIALAPWSRFAKFADTAWHKRGAEYEAMKDDLKERLLNELYRQCPSVRGHVAHAELSTPVTTKHFVSHPQGEIYGLAHSPERFALRQLRPHTTLRGFFMTGSDICTAGIGGALMGGVIATSAILGKNVIAHISRG